MIRVSGATWLRLASFVLLLAVLFVPQEARMQNIQTDTHVLVLRVAPGSLMPVNVKLTNFGSSARTDVVITYEVRDTDGSVVHTERETYAVETTANFLRSLALPSTIQPGSYTVRVSIAYPDQESPAISSYPFTVERTILGVFVRDLLVYVGVALLSVALATVFIGFSRRRVPKAYEDYSQIPHTMRIYYEIVSDAIREMRMYEGDKVLHMAAHIPGLTINSDTGRVLGFTEDPASVVASLVKGFETQFNKRVNFALGKDSRGRAKVK